MIVNQKNLTGLYMGFQTLFQKGMEHVESQYDKIAMIVPSSNRDETYAWLGQMPTLREWIGSREIQNLCANTYSIKNKNYELTISVPRNDIMDDNIGIYSPLFQNMGESARLHPDLLIFELLAQGFTQKCYDGVEFFSNKHPLNFHGKQTQSNLGNKALSATSYNEAMESMMKLKGEHGKSLKIVPDLLVVAPQNAAKAREILFSDLILGSTNLNKGTCDLLVVPELADYGEQWYLLSTKRSIRPLIFQEREKPRFISKTNDTDDNVFFQDEYLYGVNARYNTGYGLWQLAYGSTGTVEEIVEETEKKSEEAK